MSHRQKAYEKLTFLYGFLQNLPILSALKITENVLNLVKAYSEDLKGSLREESIRFAQLLNTDKFLEIGSKKLAANHKLQLCIA